MNESYSASKKKRARKTVMSVNLKNNTSLCIEQLMFYQNGK